MNNSKQPKDLKSSEKTPVENSKNSSAKTSSDSNKESVKVSSDSKTQAKQTEQTKQQSSPEKNKEAIDSNKESVKVSSDSKTQAKQTEQTKQQSSPEKNKEAVDSNKESVKVSSDSKAQAKQTEQTKQQSSPEQNKEAVDSNKESVKVSSDSKAHAKQTEQTKPQSSPEKNTEASVKLNSLFAFKVGMTNVYEKNQMVPVTVLQYKTAHVTQIKTKEKEGYTAVQTALESSKKAGKALANHLKKAGFKNKAMYIREARGSLPEGVYVGQKVSIESLQKGDKVFVSGLSKGHGFSGVVKRWGFGGGPAAHGAEKHRTTGSIANTATQGRVFPGKKMPGRFGYERITQKSRVVDILPDQEAILVQGPVPGAKNSLIEIRKQEVAK